MAKRAPSKAVSAAKSLQEALKFAAPAYKAIGAPHITHVVIYGRWLYAFDGIIAAGSPIDDDIAACPHGIKLAAALNRTGSGLSIAQSKDGDYLSIKLGAFRARVPCVPFEDIPPFAPDPMIAPIDDRIKTGFGAIAHIASDNAQKLIHASILVRENTMASTNGAVLLEYRHGIDLPPNLVVPKVFAAVVLKCDKQLSGFGFSDKSVTVYYTDGSWYRTQRYVEHWPDIEHIFSAQRAPDVHPIPTGFFEGLEAIAPFSGDGAILRTLPGSLIAGSIDAPDATYDCPGTPGGLVLGAGPLRHVAGRVATVSWGTRGEPIVFYADDLRAAVARAASADDDEAPPPSPEAAAPNSMGVSIVCPQCNGTGKEERHSFSGEVIVESCMLCGGARSSEEHHFETGIA